MRLRALCLLTGVAALAGCGTTPSSQPASPVAPATSLPTAPSVAASATPLPAATHVAVVAGKTDYDRGETEVRAHNYVAAKVYFHRSIQNGQSVAASYAGLGAAEDQQGHYSTGYAYYKKGAALAPSNFDVQFDTAYAALDAKQYQDAVGFATRAISLRPKAALAYHVRMLAYGSLNLPKGQLDDARQIVRLAPKSAEAYDDLGIALANNKKLPQSRAAFTQAIQLSGKNYRYFQNRAIVEELMRQFRAALADLQEAQALAPSQQSKQMLGLAIKNLKKQMQHSS